MTHTKGPWVVTPNSGEIGTADGKVWVARAINATTTEGQANAHLIAAAPELLEALRAMVAEYDQVELAHHETPSMTRAVAAAISAIAKAEGRT